MNHRIFAAAAAFLLCAGALAAGDYAGEMKQADQLLKERKNPEALAMYRQAAASAVLPDDRAKALFNTVTCLHRMNQQKEIPAVLKPIYDNEEYSESVRLNALTRVLSYVDKKTAAELAQRLLQGKKLTQWQWRDAYNALAAYSVSQQKYQEAIDFLNKKNEYPNYPEGWKMETYQEVMRIQNVVDPTGALAKETALQVIAGYQKDLERPNLKPEQKEALREKIYQLMSNNLQFKDELIQKGMVEIRNTENSEAFRTRVAGLMYSAVRKTKDKEKINKMLTELSGCETISGDARAGFMLQRTDKTKPELAGEAKKLPNLSVRTLSNIRDIEYQYRDFD